MAIEDERGCGFRKVGGLYFVGAGLGLLCDRMPFTLTLCPVCGHGIKFSRGFQWVDWYQYAGEHRPCECPNLCPMCHPIEGRKMGLMWVGDKFYSPAEFMREAEEMGVSKRINSIPKNFVVGEDWILLAHKKAGDLDEQGKPTPAIFYGFKPHRVEMLIYESDCTPEMREKMAKRGITPVIVPDNDTDHPRVGRDKEYNIPTITEKEAGDTKGMIRRLENYVEGRQEGEQGE